MATDNKPKLQLNADKTAMKINNDTNQESVVRTGSANDNSPNEPVPSSAVSEQNLLKNPTAGPDFNTNTDILSRTNEERSSTSLRTMADGSKTLMNPNERVVEGSLIDKQRLNNTTDLDESDSAESGQRVKESHNQKKVRVMNSIHTILKLAGADSQQQQKALVQLSELLFDDNEVLNMSVKYPETGNEPAGSRNPNIAPSQVVDMEAEAALLRKQGKGVL